MRMITITIIQLLFKVTTITIIGKKHDYDYYDYDYRAMIRLQIAV